MKWIVYKFKTTMQTTDENGELVDKEIIGTAKKEYSEANEEIAKREAYEGKYTIEDDGVEEILTPTTEERVEALEAAVTMLCMPDVSEV